MKIEEGVLSLLTYERFRSACRASCLKATRQRFLIYSTLLAVRNHPSAQDLSVLVAALDPSLSRDTIYRTLDTFVHFGLAERLCLPGGAARFDPDTTPHHHFYCQSCGTVFNFHWPEFDTLTPPETLSAIGLDHRRQALIIGLGACCASAVPKI